MTRKLMKTVPVTLLVLATILLAGCTAGPDTSTDTVPETPKTSEAPTAQTQPEKRQVKPVEVIDPMTIVVTPIDDADELYGENITVHINDIISPEKGDCGYDQALALAKTTIGENLWFVMYSAVNDGAWIDEDGDHYGYLDSTGTAYGWTMIKEGFAHIPDGDPRTKFASVQDEAKSAGAGLWSSCPDFGADR